MKRIKSGIRWGVFFGAMTSIYGNTSLISLETTSTQAMLRIHTDQTGSCTVKASEVNVFDAGYAPINDLNTSYFSGSDQCSRAGNIVNGDRYTLVIGKRAAELGSDGIRRYSRALQTITRYYYSIAIGSDTLTGSFTTGNIPLGLTRNDTRFDRNRPGEYAFPSIDWTSGGKATKYIDPTTGLALRRASGPGELFPTNTTGRTFDTPVGGTGWSGSVYAGSSGPPGTWLRLRATDPRPAFFLYQSLDAVQLVVRLSGTATGVEACITNDGATCAGALLSKTITTSPTSYTFGTTVPILDSWMNSPVHPSNFIDTQPRTGNVTKSGTSVTWNSGAIFNPHWRAGSIITLGGTDCAIASLTHEKTLVLADSSCKADGSYNYVGRNWGFLIRTTTAGTLTVAAPTWTSLTTGDALMGSYGAPRMCSPVKYDGGYLCSTAGSYNDGYGSPIIYWFGDDGTFNPLGIFITAGGRGLDSRVCSISEGVIWDWTVPGKYWCIGVARGVQVVYSVQYSGNHKAKVIAPDSSMPDTATTIRSNARGIGAEVATFSASDPNKFAGFSCMYGWRLIGRQGNNLLMNCLQTAQDSPAWYAVYSTVTNSIVAATCSYCGQAMAPNRWGVNHAQSLAGDTDWTFIGTNPYLRHSSSVTSGTLTASLSACPVNTVNPELAGQSQCSTLTLDSLQPTYMGASLFGQNWELGDIALVLADGAEDKECVRMLKFPGGTQAVVLRNYHPYACNGISFTDSKLDHAGSLVLRVQPSVFKEWWWDFKDDSHGTDTTNKYLREDPHSADCHEIFELETYVIGCLKDRYVTGVPIRNGNPPESFSNTYHVVNSDGGFMGSAYTPAQNCNEHHPSMSQVAAIPSEQVMVLDLRPHMCDLLHATSAQMSHVAGRIYKMNPAGSADLQYREQGFVVGNGVSPMVDVSPAALTDTPGDEYKYCFVVIAGNCYAGSRVGETYFNVPIATTGYETGQRFVDYPLSTLHDINLTQNGQTMNSLMQVDGRRASTSGEGTRRLSSVFAPYRIQNTYWNGRALPDNSRAYFAVDGLDNVRSEIMVADLPPWPSVQPTNRGTGVPVRLSMAGVSGDTVRVRFGYAENGPATSLYCHERQTACATDASGALPFVWTDETQHWTACNSGCTVNVPAISGRLLYYVVDRKNGSATVSDALEAVLVP